MIGSALGHLVCLAVLGTGPASAQPAVSATFGGSLDSFTSAVSPAESRGNVAGAFDAEHLFSEGRGRVYYDLAAGRYDSPGDWSFFRHTGGATFRFGDEGPTDRKLFLNASFERRVNGDAWSSADYSAIGAGLNAETHPSATSTLRAGYRTDYRSFSDLAALTQFENRVFASALVNLQTKTTLIVETQAGAKLYDGVVYDELPAPAEPAGAAAAGYGRGGTGRNMGPGSRWTTRPTYATSSEEGSAGLVSVMGRVAQSLTDRTGAHAQAMARWTFGAVPPVLVTTPAGFFEDGVYDDPFASDGVFLQAGVKHSFANGAEIDATGWWADKRYTSVTALDLTGLPQPGAPLRADTVTLAGVTWSQPLFPSRTGAIGLTADLGYRYTHHQSNDAFYNYTSHALVMAFTVGY